VFKEAIPPDFPEQLNESMNFIFGKKAFFGIAPASDGVSSGVPSSLNKC
jgi:hypothetical protein